MKLGTFITAIIVELVVFQGCTHIRPPMTPPQMERIIHAEVSSLDHPLYYNRFGSVNPYGMIYALDRDVVTVQEGDEWIPGLDCPSSVRLRDGKRPRPLVLRGNVGDVLEITFTNRLLDQQPDISQCTLVDSESPYSHLLREEDQTPPIDLPEQENHADESETAGKDNGLNDWPATRSANLMIVGLTSLSGNEPACNGLESIPPGKSVTCQWKLEREGTHLFSSHGAPSGGEGDGGSLTHGLFGAVIVEPQGSQWYRSQVTDDVLDKVWPRHTTIVDARKGVLDYDATDEHGIPYLNILKHEGENRYELIHGDPNVVVVEASPENPESPAFREFTAIFHDELKTFYANDFQELETSGQLAGIRDGFAVNYGSSGMGSILLANRKGIGPSAKCKECLYEEFFLQSWANGDPALLENFEDDPSNVFHSYLNDRVQFRNLHAGPKETHVFHLHAHQWLSSADTNSGTYLDSQTIAPQQGFSYEIYDGGLLKWGKGGWYLSNGSGNRNRAPGDSIFHCHLYPHFAQGMWALWRVHDVIEDGTRKLPDGQSAMHLFENAGIALSGGFADSDSTPRLGTDPLTGLTDSELHSGTPIPAVLPLPGQGLPLLPLYAQEQGMPGYPFYMPGKPGHRAPQPPLDFAKTTEGHHLHAGLPRHVFGESERRPSYLTEEEFNELPDEAKTPNQLLRHALATGDFREELIQADVQILPDDGTPLEKSAMQFHAGQAPTVRLADGTMATKDVEDQGYPTHKPEVPTPGEFFVNGADPKPGAPFADPCGAPSFTGEPENDPFTNEPDFVPDPAMTGNRRYEVSAIELDLVVNRAGWHDPQARINVLTNEAPILENTIRNDQEPFFFRAASGECIEYRHQNRMSKELQLDDFQVATPTDIIGQHIHLVKFDVTSSDGSANGFNYEDGTLAPDAVEERIHAANAFGGAEVNGDRKELIHGQDLDGNTIGEFQTTIQRWFADPLLTVQAKKGQGMSMPNMPNMPTIELPPFPCPNNPEEKCRDRTLRTVFTHDHFAPSSIQQHGFYSALLVEPAGSKWLNPDGSPLEDADGQAVGSKAMIVDAKDWMTHENHREFALAVADFALLYDPRKDTEPETHGMGRLLIEAKEANGTTNEIPENALQRLQTHANTWWKRQGRPVDPPEKPEAISTDHHNPYLVNYKHEPLPLRVGKMEKTLQTPEETECGLKAVKLVERNGELRRILKKRKSIDQQKNGKQGDMAYIFDSFEHGDPCTPILEAYEGERIQIRMVQGAQEVQHMFSIEGFHWPRIIDHELDKSFSVEELAKQDNRKALISTQEIGISEHFEMDLPLVEDVGGGLQGTDNLYHFGTIDALWNGAWGLIRTYNGTASPDPQSCDPIDENEEGGKWDLRRRALNNVDTDDTRCQSIGNRLSPIKGRGNGKIKITNPEEFGVNSRFPTSVCPNTAPKKEFVIAATRLDRLGANLKTTYNATQNLYDPNGLVLLSMSPEEFKNTDPKLTDLKRIYTERTQDGDLEPLVLRVNAGDCLDIRLVNHLSEIAEEKNKQGLPDATGDALMPRIVPLNVDARTCQADEPDCEDTTNVRPSIHLALSIPTLPGKNTDSTLAVGQNNQFPVSPNLNNGQQQHRGFTLYAGLLELKAEAEINGKLNCPEGSACPFTLQAIPYAFGTVPIKAFGDIIGHGVHGLFGALLVEPAGATYHDLNSLEEKEGWELGTRAVIKYSDENQQSKQFREFVVMYQDGLNLHWPASSDENGSSLPDGGSSSVALENCPICDDSYDRGEKGINYRTDPFWARLRNGTHDDGTAVNTRPGSNLNHVIFPENFFQESFAEIPTPVYEATAGEDVRFRVVQPHGRARQRTFLTLGHDYQDLLPQFGSPHSALISAGKAITATIEGGAKEGCYMYRDGPSQIFAGGAWGRFNVNPSDGTSLECLEKEQN
ncbi:MAG: hypothetical protein NPIRA04_19010 [Nitrospirales bacterium]|nr:MAG: hypothetical protein NPIRA04_19010 [Nitrospirales bacterium]